MTTSIRKNVAGQKVVLFAFDRTTNSPILGDAANITAVVHLNGAASGTALTDVNPVEMSGGLYAFDLEQTETDADLASYVGTSTTADVELVPMTFYAFIPQASSGGGSVTGNWKWSTDTTETDPTTGKVKVNNAVFGSVTEVFISSISDGSAQATGAIERLDNGDRLILSREGAANNFIIFEVSGPPVSQGGGDWYSIPGTVSDSGGSFGNNNTIVTNFSYQADSAEVIAVAVWAALRAGNQAAGSFGENVLADVIKLAGDIISATNQKNAFDGVTGNTGDTFNARQDQVSNLAAGSGGGQTKTASGVVTTTVGTEVGTFTDTTSLNGVVHSYEPSGGITDFFYTFNVGNIGVATQILLNYNADMNGDTYRFYGKNFNTSQFDQVFSVPGTNSSTITPTSEPLIFTVDMTDENGDVEFRVESTDGVLFETDRILVEFVNLASQAIIFSTGTAQSGGPNTIQAEVGTVTEDDQFVRSRILLTAGTGAGQEGIIASTTTADDVIVISTPWVTEPDGTTQYVIGPGQSHASTQNGSYGGMVHFNNNPGKGFPGRIPNVHGTSSHPSNNEADTYALGIDPQVNTNVIEVATGSTFVLPSNSAAKNFGGVGVSTGWFLDLNGQDITGSRFDGPSTVTGTGIGSGAAFFNGAFSNVTLDSCSGKTMGFIGGTTFTIGTPGNFTFGNAGGVGSTPAIIDYGVGNGASNFSMQDFTGGIIEIQNAGAGAGSYLHTMNGIGELIVNANCSATTTVSLSGHIKRNADVAGIVYEEKANVVSVVDFGSGQSLGENIIDLSGEVTADMDANSTQLIAILADTGELQTDWEDGGRLDLILDGVKAKTDQLTFTVTNLLDSNLLRLNGSLAAAVRLALSAGTIVIGTVDTTTNGFPPTTTNFQTNLTEATADHFSGRSIIWTSGELAGLANQEPQATSIVDYVLVGTIGQFTVVAMTEPPTNNDTFIIV